MRTYPPLGLHDELPFGKYRGATIDQVLQHEPEYIRWLLDETNVQLADDAYTAYRDIAREIGWE